MDQAAAPVAVAERDALTGDYTIDASHSRLGFSARHAVVTTVRGQFPDFEGAAHVDAENPAASSVSLTIRPASVSTGSADRDGHLVSADFSTRTTTPSPSPRPRSSATAPSGPSPAT